MQTLYALILAVALLAGGQMSSTGPYDGRIPLDTTVQASSEA